MTLTEEQKQKLGRRQEYKRNYQKRYYAKMRESDAFMEKRRENTKDRYAYTRKTIDCPHCKLRHRPDSEHCLLLKQQRINSQAKDIINACNELAELQSNG